MFDTSHWEKGFIDCAYFGKGGSRPILARPQVWASTSGWTRPPSACVHVESRRKAIDEMTEAGVTSAAPADAALRRKAGTYARVPLGIDAEAGPNRIPGYQIFKSPSLPLD